VKKRHAHAFLLRISIVAQKRKDSNHT